MVSSFECHFSLTACRCGHTTCTRHTHTHLGQYVSCYCDEVKRLWHQVIHRHHLISSIDPEPLMSLMMPAVWLSSCFSFCPIGLLYSLSSTCLRVGGRWRWCVRWCCFSLAITHISLAPFGPLCIHVNLFWVSPCHCVCQAMRGQEISEIRRCLSAYSSAGERMRFHLADVNKQGWCCDCVMASPDKH